MDFDGALPATLAELLRRRAECHPDRTAAAFTEDGESSCGLTYAALYRGALAVANALREHGPAGQRALLLYPPGLEFMKAFFGCSLAGWAAVPTCYPKAGRAMPRFDAAARDCQPAVVLADAKTRDQCDRQRWAAAAAELPVIATDTLAPVDDGASAPETAVTPETIGLLQYTSGSTTTPKGVIVTQANLTANLEAIRRGFGLRWQTGGDGDAEVECGLFWLPAYHDMGLIGGLLAPLWVGGRTMVMPPQTFLRRPRRWLEAISRFRAIISGAPNFAYQFCVDRIVPGQLDGLDLSCWEIAFCGAEPIVPRTLDAFANRFAQVGFRASSYYPCYGLAEATLLASGGEGPAEPRRVHLDRVALAAGHAELVAPTYDAGCQTLISCGPPAHRTRIQIVDPETYRDLPELRVGEIWLEGDSIARGYWNRSGSDFSARRAEASEAGPYFRSGDLGFVYEGELFVTGRRKDVVIVRGRNHYPQDIEATVREAIGAGVGAVAAFAVSAPRGEALGIVAEVDRHADQATLEAAVPRVRRAVIEAHEVDPRQIILARPATIPLTSSGKLQRWACRAALEQGKLRGKLHWQRGLESEAFEPIPLPALPAPDEGNPATIQEMLATWLLQWLVIRAGIAEKDLQTTTQLRSLALDSLTVFELSGDIEDWLGVELEPTMADRFETIETLAAFLETQWRDNENARLAGDHSKG